MSYIEKLIKVLNPQIQKNEPQENIPTKSSKNTNHLVLSFRVYYLNFMAKGINSVLPIKTEKFDSVQ